MSKNKSVVCLILVVFGMTLNVWVWFEFMLVCLCICVFRGWPLDLLGLFKLGWGLVIGHGIRELGVMIPSHY